MIVGCQGTYGERIEQTVEGVKRLRPYVDRMVVIVDESVTEEQRQRLRDAGCEVYFEPWQDSMVKMRNAYLKRCQHGDWVIVSDPDELFCEEFCKDVRELTKRAEERGIGLLLINSHDITKKLDGTVSETVSDFFKNLCMPGESFVYANPVPKRISDITVGDYVLGMDGYCKVLETFKRPYRGRIIKIKPRFLPEFSVTPEHPVLALKYRKHWNARNLRAINMTERMRRFRYEKAFYRAEDLSRGDLLVFPRFRITRPIRKIDLRKYSGEQVYIRNTTIRHWHDPLSRELPRYIPINKDSMFIFGLYVAEGWTNKNSIRFGLNLKEEDTVRKVRELMEKIFKVNTQVSIPRENRDEIVIIFSSNTHVNFFNEEFGNGAGNKKIPKWILEAPRHLLEAFLNGYMLGDGTNNSTQGRTVSKTLVWQLCLAYSKLGLLPSIFELENTGYGEGNKIYQFTINYKPRKNSYWLRDDEFLVPITKITSYEYEGNVYNLETASNTYLAPAILHNCFKYEGGVHYEGVGEVKEVHEMLVLPPGTRQAALPRKYYYEHVKGEHEVWERAARNVFIAGGGNNVGTRNKSWRPLREICDDLGLTNWPKAREYFRRGNIDSRLKKWLWDNRYEGFDYQHEMMEFGRWYFEYLHPEEAEGWKPVTELTPGSPAEVMRFVEQTYLDVLGRHADQKGKEAYTRAILADQLRREDLPAVLRQSPEYQERFQEEARGEERVRMPVPVNVDIRISEDLFERALMRSKVYWERIKPRLDLAKFIESQVRNKDKLYEWFYSNRADLSLKQLLRKIEGLMAD